MSDTLLLLLVLCLPSVAMILFSIALNTSRIAAALEKIAQAKEEP